MDNMGGADLYSPMDRKFKIKDYAIFLILLGIFIVFAFFLRDRGFLSLINLMNIFTESTPG